MMNLMLDHAEPSDGMKALALEAAAGSRAAFSQLISGNYDLIFHVALKWSGNREDAEDIAQTVCIKLGQAIRNFRGEAKVSTWLYRLTINAAQDHHRARAREGARTKAYMTQSLVEEQPGKPGWPPEDETEALWAAVRQLPEKTRDAVLLVYGEEMSHAEAARVLDCKEATVSWHIHDAKKRLAALLRADGET